MRRRILFLFIDGLGMGSKDPFINPIYSGCSPHLARLLDEVAVPIDATLGVEGLPQSATGQATLFSGNNASELLGRHLSGFPNEQLKAFLRESNLLLNLREAGVSATFANAYYRYGALSEAVRRRRQSVTTVAAMSALPRVRNEADLLSGKAVFQDLTREQLRSRGYDGPLLEPEEAAGHLLAVAEEYEFCLFEYFQSDLMAHRAERSEVEEMLERLDRFMAHLLAFADHEGHLLLVSSDHGNVEDSRTKAHSMNPVPLVALGSGAEMFCAASSLTDVTPMILKWYRER